MIINYVSLYDKKKSQNKSHGNIFSTMPVHVICYSMQSATAHSPKVFFVEVMPFALNGPLILSAFLLDAYDRALIQNVQHNHVPILGLHYKYVCEIKPMVNLFNK